MRDGTATMRWFIDHHYWGRSYGTYLIPVMRRAEWDDFKAKRGVHANRDSDAAVPDYCQKVDGPISIVEFSYPEISSRAGGQ